MSDRQSIHRTSESVYLATIFYTQRLCLRLTVLQLLKLTLAMRKLETKKVLDYIATSAGKTAAAQSLGLAVGPTIRVGQTSQAMQQQNAVPVLKPKTNAVQQTRPVIQGLAPAGRGGLRGQKTNPIEQYGPLNGAIDGKPGANVRH